MKTMTMRWLKGSPFRGGIIALTIIFAVVSAFAGSRKAAQSLSAEQIFDAPGHRAIELAAVDVETVRLASIDRTVFVSGTLQPLRLSTLTAEVEGQVLLVDLRPGNTSRPSGPPQRHRSRVTIRLDTPEGSSLEYTQARARQVDTVLREFPEVRDVYSRINVGNAVGSNAVIIDVGLVPRSAREASVGDCWDNAVAERFFLNLKMERTWQKRYVDRAEARRDITQYIVGFYNPVRLHSTLGYASPQEFEDKLYRQPIGVSEKT